MKTFAKGALSAASLAGLLSLSAPTQAGTNSKPLKYETPKSIECDNRAPRVKAVKLVLPDPFEPLLNTVDHSGSATDPVTMELNSNGKFDPIPLLETKIYVGGKKPSCLIAHFSAEFTSFDNRIVFQASIDDDPMEGHTFIPVELRAPQLTTPIVYDQSAIVRIFDQGLLIKEVDVPAMTSYNFFKIVKPGWHTVRIKWAGCCSSVATSISTEVWAAVLTLEYQGKLTNYEDDDD